MLWKEKYTTDYFLKVELKRQLFEVKRMFLNKLKIKGVTTKNRTGRKMRDRKVELKGVDKG